MKHPENITSSNKPSKSLKNVSKTINKHSKDNPINVNTTLPINNSNVINTPKNNAALQKFINKANAKKQIVEKANNDLNKSNNNKSNNNKSNEVVEEDEKLQVVVDDFFVSCEDDDNLPVLVAKTKDKGFVPDVKLVVKENFDNWRGRGAASRFHREFYEDELKYKKKKMNW